ncbi:hypothetical protein EDI_023820 [Entamoeba dispar SAW760]|uniref:DOCKER domain-containing protein n=1 Tax=Entamoeba dispar (strain ATCC PRA-260 / SAW760) TaxID=370354 RepID=B0EHA5_ENTDS|nr:uncharacterized protein EDI_023820 [Entamoeba dispar SAW760]EDR26098.1 hypothetical protein EDI_023820 [Entamoeba dispar SAW760]|eukprot:EDR26098.1 hypothetical protein EDI_023820 [Entamoeba dispar SAW760]
MTQKLLPSDLEEIFEIDINTKEVKKKEENETKKPKKMNEQNQKILQKFDSYDTEHNGELDVYQLKKYIEKEFNISLTEETIKYHCGQTFLQKAYKVQRSEFIAFHKYITSNLNEMIKEKTGNIFNSFENQFADKTGVDIQYKYLDRNIFTISSFDKPHALISPQQQCPNDKYHRTIYNQLFNQSISIFQTPKKYISVFEGKEITKISLPSNNEEFNVDSLIQTETHKPGSRKKKNKFLFQNFNAKITSDELLYSTTLCNAQPRSIQELLKIRKPTIVNITKFQINMTTDNLYCRMSLYDKNYIKLTSDFYFTLTSDALKDHIKETKPLNVPLVSIPLKEEFIGEEENYVVLQVYKQMDPNIDFARDIFSDEGQKELKTKKKYIDGIKESNRIFEQKGMLQLLMFSAALIKFKPKYDPFKLVKPVGDPKDVVSMIKDIDKMKTCGYWEFVFKPSKKEDVHYDGFMVTNTQDGTNGSQFCTMTDLSIQEKEDIFMDYENLLFVYPTEICLGKEKKRNGVCVTVYLRDNDNDKFTPGVSKPMAAIYPMANTPIQSLTRSFTTAVSMDIIHFFPSILQKCLEDATSGKQESLIKLFEITNLIDNNKEISQEQKEKYRIYKNPIILDSINHFVSYKSDDGRYYCQVITSLLPVLFAKNESICKERLKYCWVIYSLLIKSIIGYLKDYKAFDAPNFHDFCFSEQGKYVGFNLSTNISLCSDFICFCSDSGIVEPSIIRDANLFFAEFIRDLAIMWRHDEMAKLVDTHLDRLSMLKTNDPERINFQQLLRLEFISVLAESDRLYQINGPQLLEIKEINKLNDQLQQRHTLMFIILRQYFQLILTHDKTISKMALQELINIMNKYDLDKQFSTQTERDKFFNMIFPFVLFILDDSEKINEWKAKDCLADLYDIETLYIIFFFILKNLKEETVQQWLVSDFLPSLLNSLLTHIRKALLLFSRYPNTFIPNASKTYIKELTIMLNGISKSAPSSKTPSPGLNRNQSSTKLHPGLGLGVSGRRSLLLKKPVEIPSEEILQSPRKGERSSPSLDGTKKITGFMERSGNAQFLGGRNRSNLMTSSESNNNTGRSTEDDLIIDIALISMDFVETIIGVLVNEENTQALERAQEIISSVLFEVKPNDSYLISLYEFIRTMIITYKEFIFKRPNNLALNLLKNLLRFSNSATKNQKNFANNLIFIFAKTNFIVTGNTVATIVNATSALSELQLNDVHNIEESIKGLVNLAEKYHDNFNNKLQKCIELSLNEGVRRNKSLKRVQRLYKAIDAGDLDVFITFVLDCINVLNGLLDFTMNAEPTIINGYIGMKRDLVKMFKTNENSKMVKCWIEFIEGKAMNINETFNGFLEEKIKEINIQYNNCIEKINLLEGKCDINEKEMKDLEEKCKTNKKIGEQLLDWAKRSLSIDSCELESFDDVQLIRKIEELEKEQTKRTNEVKTMLDEYTSFDKTLTTFKLSSNPLFPVTSQEMSDGVRKVLQLHQSRIKAVNSHLQTRTSYDSEKERYTSKIRSFEMVIERKYFDICDDIMTLPFNKIFLKESIDKLKGLNQVYVSDINKLTHKKEKVGGLKPSWEIAYCSWEESISYAISVVEWLAQLIENVKNNEENILQMKKWYDNERIFVKTVVSAYLWDGLYISLDKVTMRQSNDYLNTLAKVSQYLLNHVKEAEKQYEDSNHLIEDLRKRKKLPIGFKYLQMVQQEHFQEVEPLTKSFVDKWKEEEKVEKIRKDYATLFEEFFNETDKISNTEPSKVPGSVIQKVQSLRDKLLIYDEQKIDKLNRYCDLKRSEQTVWARCSALGIPEKEVKQEKENNTIKSPRSPRNSLYLYNGRSPNLQTSQTGFQRGTRRGDENKDIIGYFITNEENVKPDCFYDLSVGQREAFDKDLKVVQDDIVKILNNLNNLNELKNQSQDPQFALGRYYQFAMDYVSAPQLHMTWIAKLANEHRTKQQFVEAGLCEVHLILFIHHLLPSELVSINVDSLKTTFGKFVRNTSVPPNPQFTAHLTEEMILQHITAACHDFEQGHMPWYGLTVASVVIPYYIKKNKYKELGNTHDFVNRMYDSLIKHNGDGVVRDYLQFYYVRLFGKVFGPELNRCSFVYSSTKERMSYLLKEVTDILPPSFTGEKHILRSLDQVNDTVLNAPDNECYILWTQVQPVYDNGDFIQYSSTFNFDELCVNREEGEEMLSTSNAPALSLFKKRTTLQTDFVLPSLLKRQNVINQSVIYLTPIEIIIEEIQKRKKNIDYFLSESKKFFGEVAFDIISFLQKSIGDYFFGSNDTPVGKSNVFNTMKIIDVLDIFYKDLDRFDMVLYNKLFDILKESTNCCSEALAVIKENSKIRKSSANLEKIERELPRIDKVLDDIEKRLEEKKEDVIA